MRLNAERMQCFQSRGKAQILPKAFKRSAPSHKVQLQVLLQHDVLLIATGGVCCVEHFTRYVCRSSISMSPRKRRRIPAGHRAVRAVR